MTTITRIPGVTDRKEREARQKLKTIHIMLTKTPDPECRSGLMKRKAELQSEIDSYEKRKAEIRRFISGVIESRRNEDGYEIR